MTWAGIVGMFLLVLLCAVFPLVVTGFDYTQEGGDDPKRD